MKPKSLLLFGGGVLLLAALMLRGQEGRQEWSLSRYDGTTVRFSIDRWKPGSHTQISTDLPFERFRGLSPDVFRHSSAVNFEYAQDAGRLVCEGRVSFGRGSGTFTFVPDPNFVTALKRLDYEAPTENQLFDMLLFGVGLDDAQAAKDAGLHPSTKQLIDLRIHGVNAAYINDVRDAGFQTSGAQDLIDMKIHGVSAAFLRDLTAAGYDIPAKQVIDLRIHGVSSEFLRDLKDFGLRPHAPDLVQLRIHGVSAGFMRDAKALGYNFTPQELVNLRIHGVDGRYLRRLHDSGMRNLNAEQIQKLKIHGID
jgi:hypothetical protein